MARNASEEEENNMALTRKFLKAMGIEDEKIEQIIEAHSESVTALKEQIDVANEKADKAVELESKLAKTEKELESAKAGSKKDDYEKLKAEYEGYRQKVEKDRSEALKRDAMKKLLVEIGIGERQAGKLVNHIDLSAIEIEEDGAIKNIDEVKKTQKEEWGDFIGKSTTISNGEVETPPRDSKPHDEELRALEDMDMADYIKFREGK